VRFSRCGSGFDFRRFDAILLGHEPEVSRGPEIHATARELLTTVGLQAQIGGRGLLHRFQDHVTSSFFEIIPFFMPSATHRDKCLPRKMFLKDRIDQKYYLGIRNDDLHARLELFADIF
jgi:hypothetical protein